MSAVKDAPVSQHDLLHIVSGDPAIISKRIGSTPSPRSASPPSPPSSSSTEDDEIDKPSVSNISDPERERTPPPEPGIQKKIINMETFHQILELDEDGDHEFSHAMTEEYFEQAEETFRKLDKNFKSANLKELSALGHFLKGSSAAIGLEKVQASCEKIQCYGLKRDEEAKKDLEAGDALDKIQKQLVQLKAEYAEAKKSLKDWFRENETEFD